MAKPQSNFHEDLSGHAQIRVGSERAFAITFCVFFTLVGAVRGWLHGTDWPWWFAAAILVLVVGLAAPRLLAPLNRAWARLGLLLAGVINPIVMALMFFVVISPLALLMRVIGKRTIPIRPDRDAPTYWNLRKPPGPDGRTMTNQF
jgi:hypothetical protein